MSELQYEHYTRTRRILPASTPNDNLISSRKPPCAPLRLSVHDYKVPGADSNGLTIVLTHGTSFNKYFWDLIIATILESPEIRRIVKRLIALDAANHGDSALLNRGLLPQKACWADDSRDILNTVKILKAQQPLVGVGHSFGGGALCHAAMMEPKVFLATIFIEPILFQMKAQTEGVAQMALRRRDVWSSRADITTAFGKSPAFRSWNKQQLKVYIDHGTFSEEGNPASPVHLKTPKEQEAATYLAAPHPEILQLLALSRGRHHFVWGSESKVISAENRESVRRIIRTPSTSQIISGADHLIPMTHPESLAAILGDLIIDIAEYCPKGRL